MDVKDLRTFLAVAEELHFGRAAERLHMAQPPVSRIVRALESELGVNLFQRDTRNVKLTSSGVALIEPAREILEAIRRAGLIVRAADQGETGLVRVAYAGASTQVMVGRLALACRTSLPGIVLELLSQNFAEPAMARVLKGEVDVALGRWDHIPAGVESRPIALEQLVLAVYEDHSLAHERELSIVEFREDDFISLAPHPGSVLGDRFRRICYSAGFEPNIVQIAPDTWTALSLVGAGVGCALTLSTVAENVTDPHVRFIRLSDKTDRVELRMAWLADSQNAALAAVTRVAEDVFSTTA